MLDGLDNINWADLGHAYGSAADVPDLLRDLLSDNEEVLNETFETLFSNIWHQGTVYEASAYAVPFLIELAGSETVLMRDGILSLLDSLAHGNSYADVHVNDPEKRNTPEMQASIARELSHVKAAHEAVRKGLPLYLRLLRHPDEEIRRATGHLLVNFPEAGMQILPVLRSVFEAETTFATRTDLLAYMGMLLNQPDSLTPAEIEISTKLFDSLIEREANPFVRLAAAVARAQQAKADSPAVVVDILVAALSDEAAYETKPRMTFFSPLYSVLNVMPGLGVPLGTDALLRVLKAAPARETAHNIGRMALDLAFPEANIHAWGTAFSMKNGVHQIEYWRLRTTLKAAPPPISLTRVQQQVLMGILESEPFWQTLTNLTTICGLPKDRDELRIFVRDIPVTGEKT